MEAEIISKNPPDGCNRAETGERRAAEKRQKELLMAFRFIIYGSPGWMLSEAETLLQLHIFKSSRKPRLKAAAQQKAKRNISY